MYLKRPHVAAMALAIPLLLTACGGGGDDAPAPAPAPPPSAATLTISGKLTAPDGTTPIANALVYVQDSAQASGGTSARVLAAAAPTCGSAPTVTWASTCTGVDGTFSFTASVPASPKLVAQKGAFKQETALTLPANGPLNLGTVAFAPATAAKLAVVTGHFDRIQDVLAKLGYGQVDVGGQLQLGTESFALFDGNESLPDPYKDVAALFADADNDGKADIYQYSVVFLNCGLNDLASIATTQNIATLRAYVQAGGRLYVSDQSYDAVEQVFPEFIDFEGGEGTPEGSPEPLTVADIGDEGITVSATVDPVLAAWLGGQACAGGACVETGGTVHIEGFLGGWAVMSGIHPGQQANVKNWVGGGVTFTGQSAPVVRPLTVSFPVGSGRVTYTSYHTEPGVGGGGFLPQERILQFMVFEL